MFGPANENARDRHGLFSDHKGLAASSTRFNLNQWFLARFIAANQIPEFNGAAAVALPASFGPLISTHHAFS